MYANLKSLDITVEQREGYRLFILNMQNDKGKLPSLYMRSPEFAHFIECTKESFGKMYGEVRYPIYDGTFTQVHPLGLHMLETSAYLTECKTDKAHGTFREYWVEFPFYMLEKWFTDIQHSTACEYTLPSTTIDDYTNAVKPDVKIDYDYELPEIKDKESFDNCLSSIMRIAENHSHGNMVQINIYRDWNEIGFSVYSGNERITNGGIIWHEHSKEYGIHT